MSKHHFDATLVFLAVAGEEQGLLGSTHWAEKAAKDGRKIEAMLTDDIVGNTQGGNGVRDNRRVRVFSEGIPADRDRGRGPRPEEHRRRERRPLAATGPLHQGGRRRATSTDFEVTLVFRRDRYGRGGDHIPFNERGFAAVRLTEPNEDFDRQHEKVEVRDGEAYGDVVERVDFATSPRSRGSTPQPWRPSPWPPPRRPTSASPRPARSYDTSITWKAGDEPDLAGYRVVWRDDPPALLDRRAGRPERAERRRPQGLSKDDLLLRRPGDRPRRQRQPARLRPAADEALGARGGPGRKTST